MSNLETAAIKYLGQLGIAPDKLTTTTSIPQIIRSDGHSYLVKVLKRRVIYFPQRLYDNIRSRHGEIIFLNQKHSLVGLFPFFQLPMKSGIISVGHTKISIHVGCRLESTTIAMHSDDRETVENIRTSVEQNIKGSFHCVGDFVAQAAMVCAAMTNSIPNVMINQYSRWDYMVYCVNCKQPIILTEDKKHVRIAWMVDCKCGHSFIAIRKI